MTTTSKRFILAGGVMLLILVALLWLTPSGGSRYRAESAVLATPYTNVFFTRIFEKHLTEAIPGFLRLRLDPALSAIPGSGAPVLTNGVVIHIITVGSTAADAQRAANEAATRVARTVLTNYGVTGEIVDRANSARSYSYFHDEFKPAIARLFKD